MGTWDTFIAEALSGRNEPEDMRRLRDALESAVVTRIDLSWDNRQEPPRYDVTLKQLFGPMQDHVFVRHSDSFMRWSLETGARLADEEQEVLRTLFLLQEGLRIQEQVLGTTYFDSLLIQYLRTLGPPRTLALLMGYEKPLVPEGSVKARALSALEELLAGLARDLNTLGYTGQQVAELMDKAFEHYVDERFQLSLRRSLLSR